MKPESDGSGTVSPRVEMTTRTGRAVLLSQLGDLNKNLRALNVQPSFTKKAARALTDDQLAEAVRQTGDDLVKAAAVIREAW